MEEIKDKAFRDEIFAHPSRAFLKKLKENSDNPDEFYNSIVVFSLKNGKAVVWTFANNLKPKTEIHL